MLDARYSLVGFGNPNWLGLNDRGLVWLDFNRFNPDRLGFDFWRTGGLTRQTCGGLGLCSGAAGNKDKHSYQTYENNNILTHS